MSSPRITAMTTRSALAVLALATALALAGCGSDDEPRASTKESTAPSTSPSVTEAAATASPEPTATTVDRTPELDAIGVIGHSGATGADSAGDGSDVRNNSWATGANPTVQSVYLRLLADHPELEGHNWNEAIDGSDVSSLMGQAEALMGRDPVPDIVFVQSIDNDIKCDGTDEQNYDPFEAGVEEVLTYLQDTAPGIKVFFVDQWTSVKAYDDVVSAMEGGVQHLTDTGPCGVYGADGTRDPKAEAYLQQQVDEYFKRIVHVCAQVSGCATDEGALQDMKLDAADLTPDLNHLMPSGHAKMAAIVWEQLPPAWK